MADLLIAIIEVISIPFQIVAEVLASIIGAAFHFAFFKQKLDENGQPIAGDHRPSNRWQILGYSLLGTVILSLIAGGVCFFVWQTYFAAVCGAGTFAFIGVVGALKAAIA